MEPAVAMVAEDLMVVGVADCLGEVEGVASFPSVGATNPLGVQEELGPGPWVEVEAASRVGACHWGWAAWVARPYWALEEGSCGGLRDHHDHHACCGSSCYQRGQSSSMEDEQEVAGCCWAHSLWDHWVVWNCVHHRKEEPEPLQVQPLEKDILYPFWPYPEQIVEAHLVSGYKC